MLRYIPFQAVLLVLIISHHTPYWNFNITIHSVPFRTNPIRPLLSKSIAYSQVVIHSIAICHNQIHYLLSLSKAKPLCCDQLSYFLSNTINITHHVPYRIVMLESILFQSLPIGYIIFCHILQHTISLHLIQSLSVLV